jgi:hypothetical protein
MDIKNFTQMVNLLNVKQIIHAHPSFDRLVSCFMVYNSMCSCGGNTDQDKSNKKSECNRIYRESLGAIDSVKAHLFQGCQDNTINFYIDDIHHVKTMVR